MNIIRFSELGEDIRGALQGKRWLILSDDELEHATAALAFSELEDVLVAVDHRGSAIDHGLWMRAVHLLVIGIGEDAEALQRVSGITQVVASEKPLETHLW